MGVLRIDIPIPGMPSRNREMSAAPRTVVSTLAPRGCGWCYRQLGAGLCGHHHRHQRRKPILLDVPAVRKRHGLMAVQLGTEKGADLIKDAAETRGADEGFEPTRAPIAWLDAAMVWLQMVVEMATCPVQHPIPKDVAHRAWVSVMAVGGDAVRGHPGHRPGPAEERPGRREIPRGAQPDIHEMAIPINGPVEILPLALNTHICLIDRPALPHHALASLA
jgi:hypothetical protein